MSIFSVALLMSQIDFLLIRLAADLIVNSYTTFRSVLSIGLQIVFQLTPCHPHRFLKNKEHNPHGYQVEGRGASRAPCDSSVMEMTSPLDEEAHPLAGSEKA